MFNAFLGVVSATTIRVHASLHFNALALTTIADLRMQNTPHFLRRARKCETARYGVQDGEDTGDDA